MCFYNGFCNGKTDAVATDEGAGLIRPVKTVKQTVQLQIVHGCIGVLYGYGDREELESAGADYIAETVNDIAKYV